MKQSLILILLATGIGACDDRSTVPQANPAPAVPGLTPGAAAPDNSGVNTRDRDAAAKTAGMQSQARSDVDITAAIRKRVTDTKMSINAQNVKIVTESGKVTLRGPVASQEEKNAIAAIANEVIGAANVDNQLEVTTN